MWLVGAVEHIKQGGFQRNFGIRAVGMSCVTFVSLGFPAATLREWGLVAHCTSLVLLLA